MTSTTTIARHGALDFQPGPFLVRMSAPVASAPVASAPAPEALRAAMDQVTAAPVGGSPRYGVRRVGAALGLVVAGAVLWTVLSFAFGVGDTSVGAQNDATTEPRVHVVQAGETLWSIASSIDTDGDPRATVDRLAESNGGVALQVGQRLAID